MQRSREMAQTKNVSITPGETKTVVHVSQHDVGRTILLNVSDGADWVDLTGKTVKLVGTKPSGLGYTVTATISGHTATLVTTAQMTDEYGQIESQLTITSGNTVIGSANIILDVERDPHPDGTTDGSVDTIIPELTVLVERIESDATAIETTMTQLKNAAATSATNAATSAQTAAQKAADATAAAAEVEELVHDLTTPIWFDGEGYICF